MTKEEVQQFKENWATVNQAIIEEERRKTPEQRLAELKVLYQFGKAVGWPQKQPNDVEAVRARWQKLRGKTQRKAQL